MTTPEKDRDRHEAPLTATQDRSLNRRNILLGSSALVAAATITFGALAQAPKVTPSATSDRKPDILVIFGDDVGQTNISAYSFGVVGYRTPNTDRIAREGMMFTDYYAENSPPARAECRRRARSMAA